VTLRLRRSIVPSLLFPTAYGSPVRFSPPEGEIGLQSVGIRKMGYIRDEDLLEFEPGPFHY